jgi:hypothetical protein
MSYRNHSNNTISSIIDYYSSSSNKKNDEDDDILRKSYSMPLSIQDYSSSTPSSPVLSVSDKSSPLKQHSSSSMMRIRTSKSEEHTATTTATVAPNHNSKNVNMNILPQHKLDRYGFIVNMDVHGNIIASQRGISSVPKDPTLRHTSSGNVDDNVIHHSTIITTATATGAPKSSSSYSMDTNYDKPTATKLAGQRRIQQESTVVHRHANNDGAITTTAAASQSNQLQTSYEATVNIRSGTHRTKNNEMGHHAAM